MMSHLNPQPQLPHAFHEVDGWLATWAASGEVVLLLDFDGTLAPIVSRPEAAEMPEQTRSAVRDIAAAPGAHVAIVSGRGLEDARGRARLENVWYAGNHGMEIQGPGIDRVHPEARAARPALERVAGAVREALAAVEGAFVEDKELTLSIHYRNAPREMVPRVREAVHAAGDGEPSLRVTEGKEVLEVRPRIDWNKGRAVEFLLQQIQPREGAAILYIGDDRTDEDAFAALRRAAHGGGIIVADPPPGDTQATAYLRSPAEVADLLERFAAHVR